MILVPALEIAFPLMACLGVGRRAGIWGALVLLVTYTGLYGAHLAMGEAPQCNCIALLRAYTEAMDQGTALLARSTVLTLLLVPAAWQCRWNRGSANPPTVGD